MKITETTSRECCEPRDMKPYRGEQIKELVPKHVKFCCHCGQLWYEDSRMDGAGGTESFLRRIAPPIVRWLKQIEDP